MALLTDDIQDKLIELLVNEGLIEKSVLLYQILGLLRTRC